VGTRFYQDLEARAAYLSPETLALLTFSRSLELQPDELSGAFLGVSGAAPNPKPFIVGLLPPQDAITGKLLDRSASLSRVLQTPIPSGEFVRASDPMSGSDSSTPGGIPDQTLPTINDSTDPRINPRALSPSFWDQYVQMCNRLGVDPSELAAVLFAESGFRSGKVNYVLVEGKPTNKPQAKGFNQIIKSVGVKAVGMTPEEWDEMETYPPEKSLVYTEAYFKKSNIKGKKAGAIYASNFGGNNNPDGTSYASYAQMDGFLRSKGETPANGSTFTDAERSKYFRSPSSQQASITQNPGLVTSGTYGPIIAKDATDKNLSPVPVWVASAIDDAKRRVGNSLGSSPFPASSSTNWAKQGSASAKQANKETAENANKDLNKTELGKRYGEAQRSTILALASAVQAVQNTPPLRLMVNPVSLKVSGTSVLETEWSRSGPITQHDGKEPEKLEASGKVAAFFVKDLRGPGPGITATAASYSEGYKNFLSLYLIYRNNGRIYQADTDNPATRGIALVGSVFLYYDGTLYIGAFENFSITRTEENPHGLEYSFSFRVSYSFLLNQAEDPRFTYGIPRRANPLVSTVTQPRSPKVDVYAELERNRLEQEAILAQDRENRAVAEAYEAAAQQRDKEIGVFTEGPPPPGSPTAQVISLLKKNPPKGNSTTLPLKKK